MTISNTSTPNMEPPRGTNEDGVEHGHVSNNDNAADDINQCSKLSAEELAAAVGNITLVPPPPPPPCPSSSAHPHQPPQPQRRRSSISTLSAGSELPPSARMTSSTSATNNVGLVGLPMPCAGTGSRPAAVPPAPPPGTFSKRGSSGYRRRSSTGVPSQIVSSSAGSSMAHAAAIVRAMGLDIDDLSDDEDDLGPGVGSSPPSNFADDEDDETEEEASLRLDQVMAPPSNPTGESEGATPPRATERKKRASVLSKELVIDEDSDEDNDRQNADNERRRRRESIYEAKQERAETARRASLEASGDFAYDGSSGSLGRVISANELERLQDESLSSLSQSQLQPTSKSRSRPQLPTASKADQVQEAWDARKDKVYRRTSKGSTGGLISYSELSLDSFNTNSTGSTTSMNARRRPPSSTAAALESERDQQQAKPRPFRRTSHGSLGVMSFGELSMDNEDSSLSDTTAGVGEPVAIAQSSHDATTATAPRSKAALDNVDSTTADNSFEESTSRLPQESVPTLNDGPEDNPTIPGRHKGDKGAKKAKQPHKPRPFRRTSHGSLGVMSFGSLSLNSDSSASDTTAGSSHGANKGSTSGTDKSINRHRTASTADGSTSTVTAELTLDDVERLRPEASMPLKDHSRRPGNSRPCPHTQVYRRSSLGSLGKHLSYGELSLMSTESSIRSRDP